MGTNTTASFKPTRGQLGTVAVFAVVAASVSEFAEEVDIVFSVDVDVSGSGYGTSLASAVPCNSSPGAWGLVRNHTSHDKGEREFLICGQTQGRYGPLALGRSRSAERC